MIVRLRRLLTPLCTLTLLLAAGAARVGAQATIRGKVTNEAGGPLQGTNVFIRDLSLNAVTDANGAYTILIPSARAQGQTVVMTVRHIGYSPQTRSVVATGEQTQDYSLHADPLRLEQVVVTGVAEATSTKVLPFSVAKLSEEQIKEVPATSPVAALAGKVAGVRVTSGRGNPGAAPTIRLRGSTNLTVGESAPMIIVDGVITRNSIADLDANDIASIEVLKGAAAASFYGSDAANGVIAVTTKRGRDVADNNMSVTVRSEYGRSGLARMIDLNQSHHFTVDASGNPTTTPDAEGFADNAYPASGDRRWRNQLKTWMTNGDFYTTNVQLGLRRGNTNFGGSFTNDRNQGTLPLTKGQFRQNLRLNVDQGLTKNADFSASVTYGLQNLDYDPNGSAGIFALLQAPPDVDLAHPSPSDPVDYFAKLPYDPSSRGNPLYGLANDDYTQRRERVLGAFSARYRPWEWLRFEGSYGTDRLNRQDRDYQFRGYYNSDGTPTKGSFRTDAYNNVATNQQVSATATKLWFENLLSTTRVAYLREEQRNGSVTAGGSALGVTGVEDLDAVTSDQNYVQSETENMRTLDYMAAQSLDFKSRYIVDLLYRRDGSSLFGSEQRWADFYRVAGAYRLSEDFHIPGIQELKLRAARGTAGLRPRFDYQYETYSVSAGGITKQNVGNKQLKPAIQTEDEYGINTTFLDRFDLELVYAKRLTKGAFLNVPLSQAQSGGFQNQWQNAADVSAKTAELSLNTRVIDKPNFGYTFSVTGDRTRQKIDQMGVAPFRVNAGGQGQNVFYYKAGEPLGIIYGTRWVRSFEELKRNPAYASANAADYVVNPLGFLVLAANRGKPGESPIKYVGADGATQFSIGDVNPDFSFGWANNLRVHNFNVYALFDGQRGGDVYNFNKQWMFQDYRHGDEDQAGKPQDQKVSVTFYSAGLYNGLEASDYFVEDASYVKLRELSVSYTVNSSMLTRLRLNKYARGIKLALIGRNLFTWTNYSGFDPDVTSGGDFNFRIEGFRPPQFRTVTGQIELTF